MIYRDECTSERKSRTFLGQGWAVAGSEIYVCHPAISTIFPDGSPVCLKPSMQHCEMPVARTGDLEDVINVSGGVKVAILHTCQADIYNFRAFKSDLTS